MAADRFYVKASWLGLLNFYCLRRFWLRLARVVDDDGNHLSWKVIFPNHPSKMYYR